MRAWVYQGGDCLGTGFNIVATILEHDAGVGGHAVHQPHTEPFFNFRDIG